MKPILTLFFVALSVQISAAEEKPPNVVSLHAQDIRPDGDDRVVERDGPFIDSRK